MGTIRIFSIWWFQFIFIIKWQRWCKVLCLVDCNHEKLFFSDFSAGKTYTLKGTELSLVSKYSKKIRYADIASYYCPSKLPVTAKCGHVDHAFGKGFCLSMVHIGVNKNLSNNA